MFGYMGKILRVNLTDRTFTTEPLPEDLIKRFLGGRGFGAKILFDEVKRGTEAFSPENKLIFSNGPLTGTAAPGSKMSLCGVSPANNSFGDSHIGGHIGPTIKYAGYDTVILEGKADSPIYLFIDDKGVQFKDATKLWGLGTFKTEDMILAENPGGEVHVMSIGPAGEKLVRIACISHDYGRQFGRCGYGAVMGSKNVKAIAARGNKMIPMADPKAFQALSMELVRQIMVHPVAQEWHALGTALHVEHGQEVGCLPTKNHRFGVWEHMEDISSHTMRRDYRTRDKACFSCSLVCGKYCEVKTGPWAGTKVDGPEYEIIALMGSNTGMKNLGVICKANLVADDLGIDAISAGNIMAFGMECFEKGYITKKDTGGLDFRFGNEKAYIAMLEKMARRQDIGDVLAEGVARAAEVIGQGSEKFAMHSKGLEQSGYETRGAINQVVGYSINDRGADHNRMWNPAFFEGDQRLDPPADGIKLAQCKRSAPDIMGMCRFLTYFLDLEDYGRLITYATGNPIDAKGILDTAERVYNMTRIFNYQNGYTRDSDHVPYRVLEEVIEKGPRKGEKVGLARYMKKRGEFYAVSGWDEEGIPSDAKLKSLGLKELLPAAATLRKKIAELRKAEPAKAPAAPKKAAPKPAVAPKKAAPVKPAVAPKKGGKR